MSTLEEEEKMLIYVNYFKSKFINCATSSQFRFLSFSIFKRKTVTYIFSISRKCLSICILLSFLFFFWQFSLLKCKIVRIFKIGFLFLFEYINNVVMKNYIV